MAVGSDQELQNITGQKLKAYLGNPQVLNGYTYVANNPLRLTDPTGETLWDVVTGQQSWGSYVVEIGDGANYLYNNNSVARVALDHPIGTGAVVGIGGGLVAYGASAEVTYGLTELGILGTQTDKLQSTPQIGLRVGDSFGKLGKVIQNTPQKITGFTQHGLSQAINREVLTPTILNTVRNPLTVLQQTGGNNLYLSEKAAVVLNKAGQVVTTYGSNLFKPEVQAIVNKALE